MLYAANFALTNTITFDNRYGYTGQLLCVQQIMNNLSCLPAPAVSANKSYSVIHGLSAAVEALCRPTHHQHQQRTALAADVPHEISNRGRIICLTTLKRFCGYLLFVGFIENKTWL